MRFHVDRTTRAAVTHRLALPRQYGRDLLAALTRLLGREMERSVPVQSLHIEATADTTIVAVVPDLTGDLARDRAQLEAEALAAWTGLPVARFLPAGPAAE